MHLDPGGFCRVGLFVGDIRAGGCCCMLGVSYSVVGGQTILAWRSACLIICD